MNSLEQQVQSAPGPGLEVKGSLLARNTGLNVISQVVPILINLAAIPYVVHHLGADRFGLLSLAWLVVGCFALFDLGMGPATTKFVAELLGKGEIENLPSVVWTAVSSQSLLGTVAAVLLALATPLLVNRLLNIPIDLRTDAVCVFMTLAISLPVSFATGSLGGVLSAAQRFDILNAVNLPSSCLTYLLPCAALAAGYGLRASVLLLVLARIGTLVAILLPCLRLYPSLRKHFGFDRKLARVMFGYGGWVTVSGVVGPILAYFERFLIGGLMSVASVGYYTPSWMISSKLGILPSSLSATLFPAFSASAGRGDSEWIRQAFLRSLKILLIIMGPVALILIFFARPILTLWVGATFANKGTLVLQILTFGALLNSVSLVPYQLLQGVGRPDLTAKFHLLETPLYIGVAWFLVSRLGLVGAALAFTFRVGLDFALLVVAACRINHISANALASRDIRRSFAILAGLAVGLLIVWGSSQALLTYTLFSFLLAIGFALSAWFYVLDTDEKSHIRMWTKLAR
jgi:O-antigen/teichoic acid export membrane protein